MQIKRTPYPMYYNDSPDYLATYLDTDIVVNTDDPAFVEFRGRFIFLESGTKDELVDYIENGSAAYGILVECGSTCLKQIIQCHDHFIERIDRNLLSDQVKVSPIIYALKDIAHFTHSKLIPDYANQEITIPKGGILALSDETTLTITRGTPENFEAICKFQRSEYFRPYEYDQESIRIYLTNEIYEKYSQMSRNNREIVSAIYFPPVLMDIINRFFLYPEEEEVAEFQSSRWFLAIEDRLEYISDWSSMNAYMIAMDIIRLLQEDGVNDIPVQEALI